MWVHDLNISFLLPKGNERAKKASLTVKKEENPIETKNTRGKFEVKSTVEDGKAIKVF